jgi:hypothetical protein
MSGFFVLGATRAKRIGSAMAWAFLESIFPLSFQSFSAFPFRFATG